MTDTVQVSPPISKKEDEMKTNKILQGAEKNKCKSHLHNQEIWVELKRPTNAGYMQERFLRPKPLRVLIDRRRGRWRWGQLLGLRRV